MFFRKMNVLKTDWIGPGEVPGAGSQPGLRNWVPKTFVRFLGVLILKGDHNILILKYNHKHVSIN